MQRSYNLAFGFETWLDFEKIWLKFFEILVSKEKVKTSHGPLECLRATKCRQKGGSIRE